MSRLSQSWVKHWGKHRGCHYCRLSVGGERRTAQEEAVGGQQRWEKDSCWNFRDLQMSTPARLLYGTHIWLHAAEVRGTHGGTCPSSPLSQPGRACPTAIFVLASSGSKTCSLKTKAKSKMISNASLYASPAQATCESYSNAENLLCPPSTIPAAELLAAEPGACLAKRQFLCQGVHKGLHLPSAQLVKPHQNGKASEGAPSETFFLYAIPHKNPNG